ncbi:MAG: SusD/RagB family nutrient-binding outer membrane lipoprotein [Gemmatimonadaceae bacterium]|nr:SusD/RagB family nutrient-binding outer membrane lipoprotein [Gemmatimonadaceae bacterium]
MMRRTITALTVVGTLGVLGACDSYFSGPGIDQNPNVPSQAAADQLFVGFQSFSTANMTGDNNRVIALFTQQMAGTGRQWAGYDKYSITENDFQWDSYYNGGGLVDLRKVQDQVKGDKLYLGIAQVWEALIVGQLADMWGDIPYSDALGTSSTPSLDKQGDVYAKLQTLLDNAITNLNAGGTGPGAADLVFGGAKAPWLQVARTLKARLYLHTAEGDNSAYAKALTETASGISSAANDFTTYQSGTTGEQNQWFQFRIQRGTDIGASSLLVNLMKSRNDPRLTDYFSAGPAAGDVIIGANPGEEDDGTFAWLSDVRGAPDFRQPIVTFAENQLIRAEAQYRTGATAAALQTLNAFRATVGLPALSVSGSALLTAIMEEKYVSLFQNVEVWNDYKRTCYPNLTPVTGTTIPARFLYGASERNSNPNIPSPSQQPRRNTNDPRTTTSTDGSACKGQ